MKVFQTNVEKLVQRKFEKDTNNNVSSIHDHTRVHIM